MSTTQPATAVLIQQEMNRVAGEAAEAANTGRLKDAAELHQTWRTLRQQLANHTPQDK